jgi:hypothetical protein
LRKILVNKSEDPFQLKILFPSIALALNGVPAYGRLVYSNFPLQPSPVTEVLLEQSLSGYNLDSFLGLLGFLRECEYMSQAKLGRFEAMGREGQVDSSGRVVTPEGRFCRDADVLEMYFYCSTLRLSNRAFLEDVLEPEYILDVLEAPLYERLGEAERLGSIFLMERALRLMDSFYSQDMRFRARRQGRASGFERMQKILNAFNQAGFRGFRFSGRGEEDAQVFLSLFGA